ncbi:MAG TPA: hypothetical protein VK667_05090 [Ktedonobacteraceae bacterium]|nr:hypothetical protein [Ktedonobacteraceae bacterium]
MNIQSNPKESKRNQITHLFLQLTPSASFAMEFTGYPEAERIPQILLFKLGPGNTLGEW